ncbi:putative collagen-binding domain-containing protein [Cyclobacterium amurskyense]|uniref:putative collagen-binding domain-containing protein n=1 Tax=Cyclobacterium amurskyense TaxID=320787 RepID=UPI000A02F7E8|nr:putative collagen-binding domain-containing protein [Cyclobacterium amurskyense]
MSGMFLAGGILKAAKDYPDWEPLRKNMGYIRQLADRLDLVKMVPHNGLSSTSYCLANPGEAYVVYFSEGESGTLNLINAAGEYAIEWFIPVLNKTIKGNTLIKGDSFQTFSPPFSGDAVLYLKKQ